jgi:hypothetical protein
MRSRNKAEEKGTMKEQILHAFAEAHEKLLITATKVVTRGAAPAETWGPQEILAHIAAWEAEAFQRIPLLATDASDKTYDADLFNAGAVAAIGDRSFEQIERELRQTHQRLIDLLEAQEERAFAPEGYAQEWITASIRHSLEHAQELEKVGS